MSIFESYSILRELLPMYDYLDHWCWLMNQLSKKTRRIWKDYRLAFKHLDRSTMTVMRYDKEFDEQISELLVKSSILSCMSINIWLKSDESIDNFVSMLSKFENDKVICFELCGVKDSLCIDFESQLEALIKIQEEGNVYDPDMVVKTDESIICINSLIEYGTFESKINDKYSEYHSKQMTIDELLSFVKTITRNTLNHSKFYFTRAHGGLEIFIHTLNLPELGYQKDIDKHFTCCENCIKCSPSGTCEMFVDDFIDGKVDCFGSNPKRHIVFKEKLEPDYCQEIEFNEPIYLDFPELKSVLFKSNKMDFRLIYRFLKTNTQAKINIEMGEKHVQTCNSFDSYSILYFWNNETSKLQAFRFDSFLISVGDFRVTLELDKNKADNITKKKNDDQPCENSEDLCNGSGYYVADVNTSVYMRIENLKCVEDFEDPPFDYSNIPVSVFQLQLVFFKPDINSCYCMSKYARLKPEIKQEEKKNNKDKEEVKDIPQEEKPASSKPIPMLKTGRKKGFYRELMYFNEEETSIEEMKKKILEIDERRDISVVIRFKDKDFNDTTFIDFLFSRRLTAIEFGFITMENQSLLDYIATKIEEHSKTLFEVCCSRENGGERKGFFNITSAQRANICKLIHEKSWKSEVYLKPLFGDLSYVHSYQTHDE